MNYFQIEQNEWQNNVVCTGFKKTKKKQINNTNSLAINRNTPWVGEKQPHSFKENPNWKKNEFNGQWKKYPNLITITIIITSTSCDNVMNSHSCQYSSLLESRQPVCTITYKCFIANTRKKRE